MMKLPWGRTKRAKPDLDYLDYRDYPDYLDYLDYLMPKACSAPI